MSEKDIKDILNELSTKEIKGMLKTDVVELLEKYSILKDKKEDKSNKWIKRAEVASLLGVKEHTIWRWEQKKEGWVKPLKKGNTVRYNKAMLDKFLEEYKS